MDLRIPCLVLAACAAAPIARASVEVTATKKTLRIRQLSAGGDIIVTNGDALGDFLIVEGMSSIAAPARKNLVIEMLSGSGSQLDLDLDFAAAGKVTILLGDGDRDVAFTGSSNVIGRDLRITGGSGDQVLFLGPNAPLVVAGDLRIDLAQGNDFVDHDVAAWTVLGDLDLRGVNGIVLDEPCGVTGDLRFDASVDSVLTGFVVLGDLVVDGDVTYRGNDARDSAIVQNSRVRGDVDVDLGGDATAPDVQGFVLNGTLVGGDVRGRSSDTVHGAVFSTNFASELNGRVDLQFGDGANSATLRGAWEAKRVSYRGGTGVDVVTFDIQAKAAKCTFALEENADVFALDATADVKALSLDFGDGVDIFNDSIGSPYPFPVTTKNLP